PAWLISSTAISAPLRINSPSRAQGPLSGAISATFASPDCAVARRMANGARLLSAETPTGSAAAPLRSLRLVHMFVLPIIFDHLSPGWAVAIGGDDAPHPPRIAATPWRAAAIR